MQKHFEKAADGIRPGSLYVVATPIGNLADITLRALAVLTRADWVCAEDTRVTAKLLAAYGIRAKLVSVREHNEQQMADKVVEALAAGLVVAQVSDAGTPAVCDPGARLAARVREAGFRVVPVVGASAVMAALSAAGVPESDFYFGGFLPPKAEGRRRLFRQWEGAACPVAVFETPHRIGAALDDMAAVFPGRRITLARELTKAFETFLSGTVAEVREALLQDANQARGEMVLVIHPAEVGAAGEGLPDDALKVLGVLAAELPTRQAAELAARITGLGRKALYQAALALKDGG
ncbi:MAG: 16S rRNA (cytidine(1402)-2'-O)-methyltransferase [Neisseria sp.]|nr:16S rRNA (cytidine(1402)-2'-O)-methyltransferase [Neisseria sp.]